MKHRPREEAGCEGKTGGHRVEQGRGRGMTGKEGKRQRSASSKATASRRAPRCTICASEARSRQRRLKTRACMATTATSGVALAKNAVCKARGYRPIEGRVKKDRLKHGRDSERTRSCLTAGHGRDSIRKSARPTPTPRGIEKRQTSRSCILTGHRKGYGATICEGAHTNT